MTTNKKRETATENKYLEFLESIKKAVQSARQKNLVCCRYNLFCYIPSSKTFLLYPLILFQLHRAGGTEIPSPLIPAF